MVVFTNVVVPECGAYRVAGSRNTCRYATLRMVLTKGITRCRTFLFVCLSSSSRSNVNLLILMVRFSKTLATY